MAAATVETLAGYWAHNSAAPWAGETVAMKVGGKVGGMAETTEE